MITTIVPCLPPNVSGVGDYSFILAKELIKQHGISTKYLVYDKQWMPSDIIESFITNYCSKDLEIFVKQLPDGGSVFLHYVNYGYQKRGCPIWLVHGLRQWKAQNDNNCLVTMFHELYAFGPPWTSSFWLSPVHRILGAQLCKMSDSVLTSNQKYAEKLSEWDRTKAGSIRILPVFSSIGEPSHRSQVPILENRKRRMVVFGGKAVRARAYTLSLEKLMATCQMLEIEEIIDIGPELKFRMPVVQVPIVAMGKLTYQEIQLIMLDSQFGYVDYYPGYLAKSTIYATYCAHGVATVCAEYNPSEADGIYSNEHYLHSNMSLEKLTLDKLQTISNNSLAWYQKHNLASQLEVFATGFR